MKTFEDLMTSGTMIEIADAIKAKTGEFNALATKAATTQADLDAMTALDGEMDRLTVKHAELKKIEDAKAKNATRVKAFDTPVNGMTFSGSESGEKKSYIPAYTPVGSLKHIKVGTRQENEMAAYKFAQWFLGSTNTLKADSPLRVKAQKYCEDNGINTKTLNELQNDQGGVLVPNEFDPMLIRLVEEYGKFRQFAKISPMASETKSQPRRTAGITTYWVGEAATILASNPTFDNINLVAKKLASMTVISSEINEDSAINLADELAFEMAYGFALAEDNAGFIGDGSSTYGGITGVTPKLKGLSATIANIAGLKVGTGNAYSELTLNDFTDTVALLPQYADANSGWFVHKSFFHSVMQRLELAAGGVTANEISTGDRRPRPLFLGYPVNFVQVMPRAEANSQVCAILGDLAMAATMGDRRTRTVFTDPYRLSDKDQIAVRCTERIDINIHDVGNASATAASRVAGPVVGLITAAS